MTNRPRLIAWIARSVDDARAADHEPPFVAFLLPTFEDQLGSELRRAVRRSWPCERLLVCRLLRRTVDGRAREEKDVGAPDCIGIGSDVAGAVQIRLEVLVRVMSGLAMDGGKQDDPIRRRFAGDLCRNRLANVRINDVCRQGMPMVDQHDVVEAAGQVLEMAADVT